MKSLRSPNLRKKHRIRTFAKTIGILFLLVIFFGVPIFFSRTALLRVNTILVQGNSVVDSGAIQGVAQNVLSGDYLYVFSKSNIFFYPKQTLIENLYSLFPRIEIVQVSSKIPHTITISLKERAVKALWCKGETLVDCYFIDADGFIFDKSPSFTQNVYFVYRGNIDGEPVGAHFLSVDMFHKAETFVERIRSSGLDPTSLTYMRDGESSLSLFGGGTILFSLQDDIEKSASNLNSVLGDASLGLVKNGVLTVSSIDVRYGNKVILKKKGD